MAKGEMGRGGGSALWHKPEMVFQIANINRERGRWELSPVLNGKKGESYLFRHFWWVEGFLPRERIIPLYISEYGAKRHCWK